MRSENTCMSKSLLIAYYITKILSPLIVEIVVAEHDGDGSF